MVANKDSKYEECVQKVNSLIQKELDDKLDTISPWQDFEKRIENCREQFHNIINKFKEDGLKIAALGASTKGNVTLQTWKLGDFIDVVGDVNPDKRGSFTPGTWIPIKDEDSVLSEYDIFVILPWHFRNFFLNSEKFKGKKLLFTLPNPELVTVL
jgi:hypothetical protein